MKTLIIRLLMVIAVAPLMVEGLLRVFDPLGAHYFTDIEQLGLSSAIDEHRGYTLQAGSYSLRGWSVTELPDGIRYTPASETSACKVLMLGDSVVFGHGVNDNETAANILASKLHANIINTAFEGYNSRQVLETLRLHPEVDVAVYLIINNDMDPAWHFEKPDRLEQTPMLSIYTMALWNISHRPAPVEEEARFWSDIAQLSSDPRVQLVAFDEPVGRLVASRYPVAIIPPYKSRNSFFDPHPSAEGHQEIAASMLPIVQSAVAKRCPII